MRMLAPPSWAHPRSRGENGTQRTLRQTPPGSSPLTRGKLGETSRPSRAAGLIPAHAGKTGSRRPRRCRARAHPRSRGENADRRAWALRMVGSSPLTRGKHRALGRRRRPGGLIPAHAGKTTEARTWPPPRPAHPRSRGENVAHYRRAGLQAGSSPLTRGKRDCLAVSLRTGRLIPAHAGKTSSIRPTRDSTAAHPRSRGENST